MTGELVKPRRYLIHIPYQDSVLSMAVSEWGDLTSPVVFCMHGFFERLESFSPMAIYLSHHYRVIAIDLPGRGGSAWLPNGRYTFMDHVSWVVAAWRVLSLSDPMVLMGTSWGGLLSYVLAARYPAYCRALVLNDAPPEASWRDWWERLSALTQPLSWLAAGRDAYCRRADVRAQALSYQRVWRRSSWPFVHFDPALLRALGPAFSPYKTPLLLWSFFQRVHVPMLLLHATRSWLLSTSLVDGMCVVQPDRLCVVSVPGAFHPLALCTPEEHAEVGRFLSGLPAVSPGKTVLTPGFVDNHRDTVR